MMEFNRKHNTSIKLLRGQAMKHTDMENLGLYLRQEIRKELLSAHTALPEIIVEGPYAMVKDRKSGTSLAMVLPDADDNVEYMEGVQELDEDEEENSVSEESEETTRKAGERSKIWRGIQRTEHEIEG
nr:unnamed protein product [Haemonchus contortus]